MDADANDPLSPEEEGMLDRVIVDMPCGDGHLKEVAKELQGRCGTFNGSLRVSSQDRIGRFRAQQLIEGSSRKHEEDGYISDDDIVAGIFDMSDIPASHRRSMSKFEVSFGSVTRLAVQSGKKRVSCERAHLNDETAIADCRWFDGKMTGRQNQLKRDGKPVCTLSPFNKEGCNHHTPFDVILSAVRMTYDAKRDEYLLDAEDEAYVTQMAESFSAHQKLSPAAKKKKGPWKKVYRKDHDKLKSKRVIH